MSTVTHDQAHDQQANLAQVPAASTVASNITEPSIAAGSPAKEEPVSTPTAAAAAAADGPSASTDSPSMPRRGTIAIEPATDVTPVPPANAPGPVVVITLLLTSGARHPYKIDEKYLAKRNVTVPGVTEDGMKDPFSISVYTLKELILREWREEWEPRPSSPSSIRLIYFGRLLDDKAPLHECKFNADVANVVHMTVRPQDVVDEEDASKGKSMGRHGDSGEATAGCRCVIL
ncbi:ubiquitin-related domain-containing protein [Xylogone sp. PMI_703]|nr:ubiquitin-related domain-containing protein [Xylogone sp. PMI_703]